MPGVHKCSVLVILQIIFVFLYVQQSYPSGLTSPSFGTKQTSFSQLEASINQGSNDSWPDGSDETALQESYPKWMQVGVESRTCISYSGTPV